MKKIEKDSSGLDNKTYKYLNVDSLIEPEYRDKFNIEENIEQVVLNIERLGIQKPIIINTWPGRENIIVDGANVVRICKDLKIDLVPVYEICVDVEQEKELHFSLNNPASEFAEGEVQKLLNETYDHYFQRSEIVEPLVDQRQKDVFTKQIDENKVDRPKLKKIIAHLHQNEAENYKLIKQKLEFENDTEVVNVLIEFCISNGGLN